MKFPTITAPALNPARMAHTIEETDLHSQPAPASFTDATWQHQRTSLRAINPAMPATVESDIIKRFHRIVQRESQRHARRFPGLAGFFGDFTFNNRWSDLSAEGIQTDYQNITDAIEELKSIPIGQLPQDDQLTYQVILEQLTLAKNRIDNKAHLLPWTIRKDPGRDLRFAAQASPFSTPQHYQDWIERIENFDVLVQQYITLLKQGIEEEITLPKFAAENHVSQLQRIPTILDGHPALAPFANMPDTIPIEEQQRLRSQAEEAILQQVIPAMKQFITFMEQDYVPAARETLGLSHLPNGDAIYRGFLQTGGASSNVTPQTLFDTAKEDMARLQAQIRAMQTRFGHEGKLWEFDVFLKAEAGEKFRDVDHMLEVFNATADVLRTRLPEFFNTLPNADYRIVSTPGLPVGFAQFSPPSPETGRDEGEFRLGTANPTEGNVFQTDHLSLHEGGPGHYVQFTLQSELGELPLIRRMARYDIFLEGWATYAESLGKDFGLYQDELSFYVFLARQLDIAVLTMIDTGIHAFGWTREQALKFFEDNGVLHPRFHEVGIDQIVVLPMTTMSYGIGALEITEMKEEAMRRLGTQFDIAAFHDVIIGAGQISMDLIWQRVRRWIEETQSPNSK